MNILFEKEWCVICTTVLINDTHNVITADKTQYAKEIINQPRHVQSRILFTMFTTAAVA